jgi:hypothetical protein
MADTHAVKKALGGKKKGGKSKGEKLHTRRLEYERADNGGVHATVHRHTGAGPHHIEHHVLPDMAAAQAHLQDNMGDQPPAGGMQMAQAAPPPPEPEGDEGAAGAGAAQPGM